MGKGEIAATVKMRMGDAQVEFQVNGPKDVFVAAQQYAEVFCEPSCGRCGGPYRHGFREEKGFPFYELQCLNSQCRARLSFGQYKENNGVFARRKNEKGEYDPKYRGWQIYQREQAPQPQPQQTPRSGRQVPTQEEIPF